MNSEITGAARSGREASPNRTSSKRRLLIDGGIVMKSEMASTAMIRL
jgi:hypothetical protein